MAHGHESGKSSRGQRSPTNKDVSIYEKVTKHPPPEISNLDAMSMALDLSEKDREKVERYVSLMSDVPLLREEKLAAVLRLREILLVLVDASRGEGAFYSTQRTEDRDH